MDEEEINYHLCQFLLLHNQLPQIWQFKIISNCYLIVLWVRSLDRFKWALLLGSHKAEIKVLTELGSHLKDLERIHTHVCSAVGRIRLLSVVGVRTPFPFQQSALSHFLLQKATSIPYHLAPPSSGHYFPLVL